MLSNLTGPTPASPVTVSITGTTFEIDENNADFGVSGGVGYSAFGIGSTQVSFTPTEDGAALGGTLTVYAGVGAGSDVELLLDGVTGEATANWTTADGASNSGAFNNNALVLAGFNPVDQVAEGLQPGGIVVGDLQAPGLLDEHDQLDELELVDPQVVDQAVVQGGLAGVEAEL
eukprot:gene16347-16162_t